MRLNAPAVCDNHASLAANQEELFALVETAPAISTLIQVDGVTIDFCQQCFDTVPLVTVLHNMVLKQERKRS